MKKILTLGIMLMFLLMTVSSANEVNLEKQSTRVSFDGNTLYVGGSGEGNYTKIQDAIDNASDGDTVYVYDNSSPYYENLNVSKSIYLIGEDKNTTVIDGDKYVINITADEVTISGFTIQDYRDGSRGYIGLISILSDYNIISGNIITGNTSYGIRIHKSEIMYLSEFNIISDNIITGLSVGIELSYGSNNNISRNIIKDCGNGIILGWYSNNDSIFGNTLTNCSMCIKTTFLTINGIISLNNISNSLFGIWAVNCFNYKITRNNFINNIYSNADFAYLLIGVFIFGFEYKSLRYIRSTIKWDGNYWNNSRSSPQPISGTLISDSIPWVQFDWHPAEEPYEIGI